MSSIPERIAVKNRISPSVVLRERRGAAPAFLAVRRHFPEAAVTVAAPAGLAPLYGHISGMQATLSLSYDLNLFIQDAVKNQPNTIQSSWYLTNIFTGFEIWRGGVNLESTSFCAHVN